MMEKFIEQLRNETSELELKYNEICIASNVYNTLNNILNDEEISSYACDELKHYFIDGNRLNYIDLETFNFIVDVLLPNKDKLDSKQKKFITSLKDKMVIIKDENLEAKYKRYYTILTELDSKTLFAYFDDLLEILSEYNYSTKNKLIIINTIIKNNYNPLIQDEVIVNSEDSIQIEEVIESVCEPEENESICSETMEIIEKETVETNLDEECLVYNFNFYPLSSVINDLFAGNEEIDSDELRKFFNKYGIRCKFSDEYKKIISKSGVNLDEVSRIFDKLMKYDFNVKKFYTKNSSLIFHLILFAKEEYLNKLIEISEKNKISLKKLLKKDIKILYSEANDGRYENFIKNIELLEQYNYIFEMIDPLFIDNNVLCNVCDLLCKRYKLKHILSVVLGPVISSGFLTIIDRGLEMNNSYRLNIFKHPESGRLIDNNSALTVKYLFKKALVEEDTVLIGGETYEYHREYTEFEKKLNSYFDVLRGTKDVFIIPLDAKIDESLNDNEFIDYLNQKYYYDFAYNIEDTLVSKIKVLRVLSYLKQNGIDITEEVVKYALSFNYIFIDKDYENIDNVFKEKNNGGTLCQIK